MKRVDLLRDLFDEKIVKIISVFLEEPDKQFSLTQTASESKVNIATTLRIIDKLTKKDILEQTLIGKSKFYKLKRGEKTLALTRLLKKEEHLSDFIDSVKKIPEVEKIILETKSNSEAKLLLVGNDIPEEKIKEATKKIKEKHNFKIEYLEISNKQFEEISRLELYDLNKKIIWDSSKE
ncbi:MAG: hypothetical protein KC506_00015 [Nanoarchaeota archaeon]|nr:hypothetical protein [Nanoarchaeota archaeon]